MSQEIGRWQRIARVVVPLALLVQCALLAGSIAFGGPWWQITAHAVIVLAFTFMAWEALSSPQGRKD